MSEKEQKRQVILSYVLSGHYSLQAGARRMGLSYRQALRVKQRYEGLGAAGLIHRRRGKPSNRCYAAAFKAQVLKRYQERYTGFGPTFAAEQLAQDGYAIHPETLRGWLIASGLWERQTRKYKARKHRPRRERFGDLLQLDGSIHRWFGDERYSCLLNAVDDATSTTYAIMRDAETTEGVLSLLKGWIKRYGIPKAVYVDLKSVYVGGRCQQSVFLSVCQRLGIEVIKAYSPQAKGRVERSHGVYQDRLVKEIHLRGLQTLEEVNTLLSAGFVEGLNERFAKAAAQPKSGHAPSPQGKSLDDLFYTEHWRQVQNDWTIHYQGGLYQLEKATDIRRKAKVSVRQYLDGRLRVYAGGRRVPCKAIEEKPGAMQAKPKVKERVSYKPASHHPWRRYPATNSLQQAAT